MKLKSSWAVFIPAFLSVMGVQLFQSIAQTSSFTASIIAIIITVIMTGIITAIACSDHYTVQDYPPRKNVFSGIVLIITGIFVAVYGINGLSALVDGNMEGIQIVSTVVSLLAAIVFMLLGINITTGSFTVTTAPVLTLAPVAFFALELLKKFIAYTTEAVASSEMYDIIYVIFLLIFFYYCASIYAGIPTKFSVKSCFIFGMPAITLTFAWCIKAFYPILNGDEPFDFVSSLPEFIAIFASLFAISLLLEISLKANVTSYFAIDDDEDFSEEEELFGISGTTVKQNRTAHPHSYENMTQYGKKAPAQPENTGATRVELPINPQKIHDDTDYIRMTQPKDISNIVLDFEQSAPSVKKPIEVKPVEEDDDLGWIDKLIQDIEEEQNKQ